MFENNQPPTTFARVRLPIITLLGKLGSHITFRRVMLGCGTSFVLFIITYLVNFHWPRAITFSYSRATCFTNPVLLPKLVSDTKSHGFNATLTKNITVARYPIYSHATCIVPTQPPAEKSTQIVSLAVFNNPLLKKNIRVLSGALPSLKSQETPQKPISTKDPIVFMLDQADTIFTYRLVANNQQLACDKRGTQLSCDLAKIKLEQSQTYEIAIQRLFNNTLVGAALKQSVATVDPVQIVAASIAADQLIYHVPASLTLTLSKPVQSHPDVKLYALTDKTRRELPVTTILKEKTLTVQFTQPLPRQSVFEFSIPELKAYDGGYLVSPYTLPFRTSGGPKVMGVSVGSYKVRPGSALTLTFDTTIATNQAVKSFVRIETGSGVLAATYAIQDKRITVTPITPLPRCTLFTVKVLDGLQNEAGVSGGSAWQFRSRTLCQTTATIGSSVQGHGITAYRFGEGSSIILFVGGTHGNEKSSTYILDSWIDYFEANYERLPKDRSVIVIPKINPDGFATNTRTNARTVDLNRNFPANNWKSGVTMPDKSYLEYGGGGTPLSEPESKALADYTLSLRPRLVLTYHATGGVVVANESDDSVTQARAYGNKASIQSIGNSGIGNFFEYDTTGSYEDWLHDKHAIPALLIELTGMAGNEFARHQGAMWAISQIP